MEILKNQTNIDFMGQRKLTLGFSAVMLLLSIFFISTSGLKLGLDFTGGTLIQIAYPETADATEIRATLADAGFGGAVVQSFGGTRDVVITIKSEGDTSQSAISQSVREALEAKAGKSLDLRRVDYVGPQVGEELSEQGGLAILIALIGILIYVSIRFEKRFSLGAVLAVMHDVIIIVGVFSLLQLEFDLTVLAALLAVVGYSLNDTIVVYDRIRENFRTMRKGEPVDIVNRSVNQMLARTIMTSFTTLIVLLSLLIFGGPIIHNFAIALICGIVVGTYSSIYVASTAALMLGITKQDLMPVEKEGEDMKPII